jgi:hypothetical protein
MQYRNNNNSNLIYYNMEKLIILKYLFFSIKLNDSIYLYINL